MGIINGGSSMNSLGNTGSVPLIRKRRPLGRKKRSIIQSSDVHNFTYMFDIDQTIASPDPAVMYLIMLQCAERYSKLF